MGYKKYIFLIGLCLSQLTYAQTGIGTTTPDASAKLDVYANNKGFLPPRVTLTSYSDIITIPNPATGLLIYNTGSNVGLAAGYYFWNGNAWATIATAGGSGSFAASFLRGSRTASQSSIAVGGIVSFSAVDNTSGQDIALNTTNGKITLAPGNTYRLIAAVPNFSGNRPAFMWYNETSSSYIGSATNAYSPTDGASGAGAFGGIAEVVITPNVSTVLSFRLLSSLSSGSVTVGGLADFSTTGSYPWFEAQVISGNAPVTGQSVDYVQASLNANQTLSSAGNVIFNTSSGAGITLTSGGFELKANKTYKLEAALGGSATNYAYYSWVDNANNLLAGGSIGAVMKAGAAFTDAPQDKAVVYYTPTVNTTVYLRVINVSGSITAYAPSAASGYSSSWASIQQVGSSAIVNPWVLSGNDVYNTTGEVGIGTTTPAASALLDLTSTNKGILIPRMTAAQKAAIASPSTGLMLFQTDAPIGFYYYTGSSWLNISNLGTSSRYIPYSTNTAFYAGGQSLSGAAGGVYVDIANSDLVIDVPSGFTSNRVAIKWDTWGDVNTTNTAHGSFRLRIAQTGTSSNTYNSVTMGGWTTSSATTGNLVMRFTNPVTYIINDLAPGTYTFKLQISREGEVGTIGSMNNYQVGGTVQVLVK